MFCKSVLWNNKSLHLNWAGKSNYWFLTDLIWRMSPIWKTERDVPETDGTDGRHRRMSLRWKTKTDGPSVFMSFHLRDIRLCHSSWPSQSRRRTSPRRMALRRMALRRTALRRMPLRRMTPRRRKTKIDVPDAEGVFFKHSWRLSWLLLSD